MIAMFDEAYRGKRVFLTGHTGFKGSWLALWLSHLGARLYGYSLPPQEPSHYTLSGAQKLFAKEWLADISDYAALESALQEAKPEVVLHLAAQPLVRQSYQDPLETFHTNALGVANVLNACRKLESLRAKPEVVLHLAAQPLVRQSYQDPLETFHTNALGVANVLNACRKLESLRAVVIVTTDKVYDNKEWLYGYRECDSLGGYDPYSASKACAEIITDSMRRSFFSLDSYGKKLSVLIATARAGNVIGGGDFSRDRLLPDLVRAAISRTPASIRYPSSTRPWQFVCESLQGYLLLAQALLAGRIECASSFNFGPSGGQILRVEQVLELAAQEWEQIAYTIELDSSLHESGLLALDSSKARQLLGFSPLWSAKEAIQKSVAWYRAWSETSTILSQEQLGEYMELL